MANPLDTHDFAPDDGPGGQDAYCRRCLGNREIIEQKQITCPDPAVAK